MLERYFVDMVGQRIRGTTAAAAAVTIFLQTVEPAMPGTARTRFLTARPRSSVDRASVMGEKVGNRLGHGKGRFKGNKVISFSVTAKGGIGGGAVIIIIRTFGGWIRRVARDVVVVKRNFVQGKPRGAAIDRGGPLTRKYLRCHALLVRRLFRHAATAGGLRWIGAATRGQHHVIVHAVMLKERDIVERVVVVVVVDGRCHVSRNRSNPSKERGGGRHHEPSIGLAPAVHVFGGRKGQLARQFPRELLQKADIVHVLVPRVPAARRGVPTGPQTSGQDQDHGKGFRNGRPKGKRQWCSSQTVQGHDRGQHVRSSVVVGR